MKKCLSCGFDKPLIMFSPDSRLKDGRQGRCKSCYAKIMKERRELNPQAHRDSVKRSVQKNYDKKLERNRKYRVCNPEKIAEWKRNDRLRNKARILSDNAKRRSFIRGETDRNVIQVYALRDFYTAMSLGERFHVDHIIPLSKGGKHEFENLQIIPAIDNLRKGSNL
jgi:5-methylcytosine-specific restriction endonuclease McrA